MTIAVGERLPDATLTAHGPKEVQLADLTAQGTVVLFAVPGAYTPTCHSDHMPSFVRHAADFRAKGVKVMCVTVNDPFVAQAWADDTGAQAAGITVLADPAGSFTRAIGLSISAPGAWVDGRSQRYAMIVRDGIVQYLSIEEGRGCALTGAEALLDQITAAALSA